MSGAMAISRCAIAFALTIGSVQAEEVDQGYELLFKDSNKSFSQCWNVSLPDYAKGTYVIGSAAQFAMGDRSFITSLDAFGKWVKFTFDPELGQICGAGAMIRSQFYENSIKENTIVHGILFHETDPPRVCPEFEPMCDMLAPYDNVYVLPIQAGSQKGTSKFTGTTDAPLFYDYDLENLDAPPLRHNWTDGYCEGSKYMMGGACIMSTKHPAHIQTLGSAHEVQHRGKTFGLFGDIPMVNVPYVLYDSYLSVYEIDQDVGDRKVLGSMPVTHAPYFHSWGFSGDFAILPMQPIKMSVARMMEGHMMGEAFEEIKDQKTTPICLLALNKDAQSKIGKQEYVCVETDRFFFMHTVNAYQNASGVILDVCTSGGNVLFSPMVSVPVMRNHSLRNVVEPEQRSEVTRFFLEFDTDTHFFHKNQPKVHKESLSVHGRITEMPAIHPLFQGEQYCIYFAMEYFHNDKDFAASAIVRHDTCTGDRKYFYQPNLHVSEPGMIPAGTAEAPGLLTFTALDGIEGKSYFYIVDAETMEFKERVELPERVTFTIHHTWLPAAVPAAVPVPVFV